MYRVPGAFLKKFRRDERGAILVEMALITPLMIALTAGVFEFGNLIHRKLLMEAGLRDAARYAARCNTKLFTDAGLTINCVSNAQNIAATGTYNGSGSQRIAGWTAGSVTVDLNHKVIAVTADANGNVNYHSLTANVRVVRVETSLPPYSGTLLSYLGIGPITLSGAQEERYIGW